MLRRHDRPLRPDAAAKRTRFSTGDALRAGFGIIPQETAAMLGVAGA
jgi:hypothetical protein